MEAINIHIRKNASVCGTLDWNEILVVVNYIKRMTCDLKSRWLDTDFKIPSFPVYLLRWCSGFAGHHPN